MLIMAAVDMLLDHLLKCAIKKSFLLTLIHHIIRIFLTAWVQTFQLLFMFSFSECSTQFLPSLYSGPYSCIAFISVLRILYGSVQYFIFYFVKERNGDRKLKDSEPPTPLSVIKIGPRLVKSRNCSD